MIELNNHKHIHMLGIGGVGVSAIAEILLEKGYTVSGSDMRKSEITARLENKSATIYYAHEGGNIEGADLVVYTAAAGDDNPELMAAREHGIPAITRAEMLGVLMSAYKNSIAVSGVHGKTTTTSMVSMIFENAKMNPTFLIGGDVASLGGNARSGSNDLFVTEACEYKDSFLSFHPLNLLILNIDEDHRDYFSGVDHIISSFTRFTGNVQKKGTVYANGDDYNVQKVTSHINKKTTSLVTFGINKSVDFKAINVTFNTLGMPSFSIEHKGRVIAKVEMSLPGVHNIYNALAAFAVTYSNGVPAETITETFKTFKGAKRRFDILGKYNGATVVDDYAHHPTEIKATLSAAKKIPCSRVITVFQPHTYTRTRELLDDFSTSFKDSDVTIITDIYAAREEDPGNIHSRDLVKKINDEGYEASYMGSLEEVEEYLKRELQDGDLVFTMGAGDIFKLGYSLV